MGGMEKIQLLSMNGFKETYESDTIALSDGIVLWI